MPPSFLVETNQPTNQQDNSNTHTHTLTQLRVKDPPQKSPMLCPPQNSVQSSPNLNPTPLHFLPRPKICPRCLSPDFRIIEATTRLDVYQCGKCLHWWVPELRFNEALE